jgi:23S rRNA (cytosine1962-C5)-methyltransferase
VRLLLRPASGGQLGCFPEHAVTATWIAGLAAADRDDGAPVRLLNLFAYTGLVSLAAAAAGATVVHVDASRTVVEWGRANAALGGLDQAPIRWIVDDAAAFTAREVRRERRYDAIVIDPPTYGHGSGGRDWRIDRDLPSLLDLASRLLAPGGYLRLSAHTRALEPDRLADMAAGALGIRPRAVGLEPLRLIASSGAVLDLGVLATARR